MKEIKLTFFATSTPAGMELVDLLQNTFASEFPGGLKVSMKTVIDGDQGDLMIAGLRDDVVIFDASVEDDVGSNYKAANMWPSSMEHFLVVSRTRLPLNFQAFHEGGSPDTSGDVYKRPFSLDNQYLVNWIKKQLELLEVQLPRPQDERHTIEEGRFFADRKAISEKSEKIIANSHKKKAQYHKNTGRAFVSYLSRYSQYHRTSVAVHGFHVEDLLRYIKNQHGDPDYPVLYYPPGSLSSEFMTEHRRWQVVSLIDWRIQAVDEIWIFETDDYYNSWWTQAELASLAYMQPDNKPLSKKILLCKPTAKGLVVREAESGFIQKLEQKLSREFERRLSNSDPLTMGYETVRPMQILKNVPIPIQWLFFKGVNFFAEFMMSGSPMYQEMKKESQKDPTLNSFKHYREMLKSHVFSESFWNDRIVTCPNCRGNNKARHNFDFEAFLYHKQPGQFRISSEKMEMILSSNRWTCASCGFQFRVVEEDYSQFLWWPVRMGRTTGPGGVYIEKIPVYTLQSISETN
ncbi:MAG: hypothetical protein QNJ36_20315 [Calothrix sp. MO_167.B42]|nr:hypothetical protein [Calothrix sp. MO_167.B42]